MSSFTVAALYQFAEFPEPERLRVALLATCMGAGVRGTLLLAQEGINGTVAGSHAGIETVLAHVRTLPGCAQLRPKLSTAEAMPFTRLKVRVKAEIVSLGVPNIHAARDAGIRVDASTWNALLADPDTIVIDTRNDYEVSLGSFPGAVDPKTQSFRDFPDWFRSFQTQIANQKTPQIAMFCTGGIRCEKATAFVKSLGFERVFHLDGGILKYLEEVPKEQSAFAGECFLFDQRVALGHGLSEGAYEMCQPCGAPVAKSASGTPEYVPGLHCPSCIGKHTERQRMRFAERTLQRTLTKAREEAKREAAPPLEEGLPLLYSFRRCPYAMRARLALHVSGIRYRLREVSLRDKPQDLLARSPKGTVPVLVLADGSVIDESLEIMLWALGQPASHRIQEPDADMHALIMENDGPFKRSLDRFKYAHRFPEDDPAEQRGIAVRFLKQLDVRLEALPQLSGSAPGLADFAILPFVRQFAAHDPVGFRSLPLQALHAWLEYHIRSPLFVEIMQR
jgi:UPF0176 protein